MFGVISLCYRSVSSGLIHSRFFRIASAATFYTLVVAGAIMDLGKRSDIGNQTLEMIYFFLNDDLSDAHWQQQLLPERLSANG